MIRILTKNGVDNTNVDGARDHNFNAGRRSGIVQGALNQGNFFASNNNTIALDTCELRLCGHRVVIDSAEYLTFYNKPSVPIRYSLVAQIIVDNNSDVSFDLHAQTSSTALVQDNLDASGSGTFELEIGKFTQLTDGTITDVVRTADLITGGAGGGDSDYIRIGTVTTNKISPELDADVDIENTINPTDNKPQTNFTFNLPTAVGTVVSVNGEEKTAINTDTTPTANSSNLITSGGVHDYPAVAFAESERQKSKNLFKSNFWNKSSNIYEVNGITFTYNPNDYSITINGTATARALCYLNPDAVSNIKIGTYTFSGFSKKTSYSVYIQAVNEAEGNYPAFLYSDSDFRILTFNIMPNFTDLYISVDAGIVVDNLVLKFQAEEGSVATDYQPYNGEIVHEKNLNEIVNGKYPIDINACTTYDQVYNLLQNATYGQCGIGVNHTNAIKSLLPTFPTNASYVDCVANVIKNKYTASVSTYAIRFTGCPYGFNQPIYYCDVFYDGQYTIVTGWYKPETVELIYDINTKNTIGGTAYTAGLNGNVTQVISSDIKRLRFYCQCRYGGPTDTGGTSNIFELSLDNRRHSYAQAMYVVPRRSGNNYLTSGLIAVGLEQSTSGDLGVHFSVDDVLVTGIDYYCYRIEGIK